MLDPTADLKYERVEQGNVGYQTNLIAYNPTTLQTYHSIKLNSIKDKPIRFINNYGFAVKLSIKNEGANTLAFQTDLANGATYNTVTWAG